MSDKYQTSGNDRKCLHLYDERWIIISLEIDTKKVICRNSFIPKKRRQAKGKKIKKQEKITDITSIDK